MEGLTSGASHPLPSGWVPIFKQWRIGCFVASLTFFGACVIITQLTPTYRAYVQLLLPLKLVEDPNNTKAAQPATADAFVVRSFSDLIKDDGISRHVIQKLDLLNNEDFQPRVTWLSTALGKINKYLSNGDDEASPFSTKEIANDRILEIYEGRLKAVSEQKSLTISLSFDSSDPHLAERIVTAHALAFVQTEVDYRRREAESKVAWMKTELDRTANEARDAQVALQLNPTAFTASRDCLLARHRY